MRDLPSKGFTLFFTFTFSLFMLHCGFKREHSKLKEQSETHNVIGYARKAEGLRRIRELHAQYLTVRDQYLLGSDGVTQQMADIASKSLQLSKGWKVLYDLVENATQYPYEQTERALQNALSEQNETLAQIVNSKTKAEGLVYVGTARLANVPRVDYDLGQYTARYGQLLDATSRLSENLEKIRIEADATR